MYQLAKNSTPPWRFAWCIPLIAVMIAGCQGTPEKKQEDPFRVTATIAPIACFALNVVGPDGQVDLLLRNGVCPHDFQAGPAEVKLLNETDLLLRNGLGLERFLIKLFRNTKRSYSSSVRTSIHIREELLWVGPKREWPDADESDVIQQVWLDPSLASKQVKIIIESCSKLRPEKAANFQKRGQAYIEKLNALDEEMKVALKGASRPVVTQHHGFDYLLRRYNIPVKGSLSHNHEEPPSPSDLANILDVIKQQGIKAILCEEPSENKTLNAIAKDSGTTLVPLAIMETGPLASDFYEKTMRENLVSLRKATGLDPL